MADLIEYKCPSCGGKIEFNSTAQKMKCPYCDAEYEMDALKSFDEAINSERESGDINWKNKTNSDWQSGELDGLNVYHCQSCGGEIVGDETAGATSCPYCGSPVVMTGQFAGDLRPDFIIPFKLDKNAAVEAMERHLSDKKLLPKIFKETKHIDEIKAVYVPYWLYDAGANADIRYRAERINHWEDSKYEYTETEVYMVRRKGDISFSNIPVDGSTKIDNDITESVEPFDFNEAVDFQSAYLAGYLADKYDVECEECFDRASERLKNSTESAFRNTVSGYDTVFPEHTYIDVVDGNVRYALLPVWLLTTRWNNEQYLFAMNGQTGKFVGNLPMDKGKYWKRFGLRTLIFGAVIYAAMWAITLM